MEYEIHQCDNMPKGGIELYRNNRGEGHAGRYWILSIMREATEKDLEESHNLEMVGDPIWETKVSVKCCPFCGLKLSNMEEKEDAESVWFEHYDMSGWKMKIR